MDEDSWAAVAQRRTLALLMLFNAARSVRNVLAEGVYCPDDEPNRFGPGWEAHQLVLDLDEALRAAGRELGVPPGLCPYVRRT